MKRNLIIILLVMLIFPLLSPVIHAYNLKVEAFPKNIAKNLRYYIDKTASDRGLGQHIVAGTSAWNSSPYIGYYGSVSREANAQQRFFASNTDKGSIVATNSNTVRLGGKVTNYSTIYTWRRFYSLSTANKNETMAHEVGHSLGLNHENSKYSIMLASGFIGRTNPTVDDLNGIKVKYQ